MNTDTTMTIKRFALLSTLALSLMSAGCASSAASGSNTAQPEDPPQAVKTTATPAGSKSAQVPRVQECGVVAISSPPKYVCGGKVYTATQLAKIRNDEAKKYQSGQ
jgi:hypothetical protein